MQYTINQIHNNLLQKVNTIYNTFISFFGEEYVDLQYDDASIIYYIKSFLLRNCNNYNSSVDENTTLFNIPSNKYSELEITIRELKAIIYVWWPTVTVTNEYNRSIDIQDLYAKIEIQLDGRIPYENTGFLLNRATYNLDQFLSDYMHSHIRCIPTHNFSDFMSPCLGNGPINNTIISLKSEYDEVLWMLFCQELAMYVTVESIKGGPWRRMENIGNEHEIYIFSSKYAVEPDIHNFTRVFSIDLLPNFIKYYLKNGHLSLSYKNGNFIVGMPFYNFIIDISNSFIDFCNKELLPSTETINQMFSNLLLFNATIRDGKFFNKGNRSSQIGSINEHNGKHVLHFKGKDITISIINGDENSFSSTILNNATAAYILNIILKIINFRYVNEHLLFREKRNITSTFQKVLYI